jgi:hypothetical protein
MIGIGSIGIEYGSWLYYGGRLGIYTMPYGSDEEQIHFVNRARETVEAVLFDPSIEYTFPGIYTGEQLAPHLAAIEE